MKKYLISGILILLLAVSVGAVLAAKPDFQAASVSNPVTEETKHTVVIPPTAIEVAPNIFYLGEALDNGEIVQGYAFVDSFVDSKKGFGKPTGCNNDGKCQGWEDASCADCSGGGNGGDSSSCYGFLSKGAKWKTVEDYIVDPTNTRGLEASFVRSNLANNIQKWETAAGKNILGDEIPGVVDGMDTTQTDGKNEVYFADIEGGAIGITVVWGVFYGPPGQRKLVEWDQVYNDADYDWSEGCLAENCSTKMDFENIATHELGHSVGLDDLYDNKCSEQTMYGYADFGETNKRTLEAGDITGVSQLYE